MATQQVVINKNQTDALKDIVKAGKVNFSDIDKRTAKALQTRGLVKINEGKKATFVVPTAKGKKFLN